LKTDKKFAKNTISRGCGVAFQFLENVRKRRLIAENPFEPLTEQVTGNKARQHFIDKEIAERVLAKCSNLEYAVIFAGARYAGLRTPSESNVLRWEDIDWQRNRFTVRASKTEHHEGKAERVVPLWPAFRKHLEALYDSIVVETGKAPEGHVI